MLLNLHISNYALIENLDIDFTPGFSVITGETGAGKSIILGALGLLLGQRAEAKVIKAGATKCFVEGTFDLAGLGLDDFFQANDIDFDGKECIIRREITAAGKSRTFINDSPAPLAKLKELGPAIIDIHSQHQNLLMGNEGFLLNVLDLVADNGALREQYRTTYQDWSHARAELEKFKAQTAKDKNDADYIRHKIQQVEEARLEANEQEALEQESQVLNHVEEIKNALFQASSLLDSPEQSLLAQLRQGESLLRSVTQIYPDADGLSERLETCRIELEDITDEVNKALERTELDPERLAYVDNRLNLIYSLEERFHAADIPALLEQAAVWQEQLAALEDADEFIAQKEKAIRQLHDRMLDFGKQLTATRQKAAALVSEKILQTLQLLGMNHARLHFDLTPRAGACPTGLDQASLLFSGNKNVPEQDVSLIASGGEIARLMLSLKSLLSSYKHMPTVIFDEIDTGVSGTMAEKMGLVMQKMAQACQVICITHMPQIAALGETHFRVYKTEDATGTVSRIDRLDTEQRIREIANMLSGSELTEAAINNAKSLLKL